MLLFVIVHTFYIKNLPLKIIIPNAIKRGNVFLILIYKMLYTAYGDPSETYWREIIIFFSLFTIYCFFTTVFVTGRTIVASFF